MAVTAQPRLDAHKLRADFPVFEQPIHGKPLAFLDSAVTSQKPRQVLEAIREFYATSYSNVHRGVYTLSERATEGYEGAREKVRAFVNAPSTREVIFTRQATEALNLVAYAWGLDNLGAGDVVVVTELEHHSNFVPWQQIARRAGADFRMLPIDDRGELRLELTSSRTRSGRSTRSSASPPGLTSTVRSWSSMRPRLRRTSASTSRRWAPTSSPSRRTRCAVPPASGCSGDAGSSWRRCRRSTTAAR
jgi:hypothetical protein